MRKWVYGILSVIGFLALFLIDMTMVVPFASNQLIASGIVFVFYLYLTYLIVFRKIF
ncbi:hypothetical protein [Ornithinibacillus halotolerans]|uniref:Uncharacterized protein n=1 Tax=Ornithinibacillus halotolerans TaxID=1274357 RepID=A0A916RK31_9BACI|nr:hypothetical protein [Ornithinibacillus halotolerans]GGA60358.1 hypothetical protein GCM10008025_00460 [Ornithinibacillus halotolerans]